MLALLFCLILINCQGHNFMRRFRSWNKENKLVVLSSGSSKNVTFLFCREQQRNVAIIANVKETCRSFFVFLLISFPSPWWYHTLELKQRGKRTARNISIWFFFPFLLCRSLRILLCQPSYDLARASLSHWHVLVIAPIKVGVISDAWKSLRRKR